MKEDTTSLWMHDQHFVHNTFFAEDHLSLLDKLEAESSTNSTRSVLEQVVLAGIHQYLMNHLLYPLLSPPEGELKMQHL